MRKLAVILVATMLCLMVTPAVSANTTQEIELFDILTQEAFDALFYSNVDSVDDSVAESMLTVNNSIDISYSYEFEIRSDNPQKADVILFFDMLVGSTTYPFCLEGTVDAFQLSWGDVLWEGPIYGSSIINGTECAIVASISKLDGNPDVQISVTIQSKTGLDEFSPVSFTFGNLVLTVEMIEDLRITSHSGSAVNSNMEGAISIQEAESEINAVDDRYTLIPYSTQTSFYNQSPGLEDVLGAAHISRAYYYEDAARVAISVTTNGKKLRAYYVENYTPTLGYSFQYTSVRNIRIELSWYEYSFDNNLTYIAGMQSFNQSDYANSGSTVLLKAFFDDAMDILGVSTATLSALFGEGIDGVLEGEMSCGCGWDNAYVDITFGIYDYVDFDIADPSLAVIFQIDTASSNTSVHGTYKYQNSVTYQTLLYTYTESAIAIPNILYNSTPSTSYTFTVDMP